MTRTDAGILSRLRVGKTNLIKLLERERSKSLIDLFENIILTFTFERMWFSMCRLYIYMLYKLTSTTND